MRFTGNDLVVMMDSLAAVGSLRGIKFAYAIAKNTARIEKELKAMRAGLAPSEEFSAYETERLELCKRLASKDELGQPQMINGQYAGLAGHAEFEREHEKLRKKHQGAVDEREKVLEEYKQLLKEKVEIDIHTMDLSAVPEDITAGQLSGIIVLVKDSEELEPEKDEAEAPDSPEPPTEKPEKKGS